MVVVFSRYGDGLNTGACADRRAANSYWYESSRFSYTAFLEVNDAGFVERYPTLWRTEG